MYNLIHTLSHSNPNESIVRVGGANSALAIGKLGYDIEFLTQVGSDLQGRELIEELKEMKVGTQYIKTLDKVNTGLGFILQLKMKENIVQYKYPDWVTAIQNDVGGMSSNVLPELYQYLDYISPNETEIERMLGRKYDNNNLEEELHQFLKKYSHLKLLLKQGETGATLIHYFYNTKQVDGEVIKIFSPAYKFADFEHLNLHLTDTAGAGDCFTGAFAAKLSEFHKDDINIPNNIFLVLLQRLNEL